ncbi:MAG: T9SS type A sorting domain-containing protein [Saprospiraceae bacterium]|nr:T9SS type A sorting domain-containing protein [Saprospiraceae bacterium]
MKNQIALALVFFGCIGQTVLNANTITVGPGKDYPSPNALYNANVLMDGDSIMIDAGIYTGNNALCAWQKNNLVIIGIGGRPHMQAEGSYIWGKGTWVFAGNNISVENIEFSGAAVPDLNGAGIRLDGSGMTVKHCFFHDNENGILTSNPGTGDILIEYSEFAYNGYGDGQSHNLYIGRVSNLIFRYNYSHHAKIGHNLKSRAKVNAILYNRIMDESDGTSSYLIDMSNGGSALVMGNLLMQGQQTDNCNMVSYALEGFGPAYDNHLYFVHNTMVNKRSPGCNFINLNSSSLGLVANNIMTGPGNLSSNPIDTMGNMKVLDPGAVGLINEAQYDYRLAANSPAINFGAVLTNPSLWNLLPDQSYVHPMSTMARMNMGQPDAGAYEYESVLAIEDEELNQFHQGLDEDKMVLFPNPASSFLSIKNRKTFEEGFSIFDTNGVEKISGHISEGIDISSLAAGLFFFKVKSIKYNKTLMIPFVKL